MRRSLWISIVLTSALAFALVMTGASVATAITGWATTQLTTGPFNRANAQVFIDRVVWQGWDGANWQIYTQKIGLNPSPVQMTFDAHDHELPQVWGDRIVWEGHDGNGTNRQIFTQRIGVDASPVQLTSAGSDNAFPQVSGNRVVWLGSYGLNYAVYTQVVGVDPSPILLATEGGDPQVSANRVVWIGPNGPYFSVFCQKVGVDTYPLGLSSQNCALPQVSGDRVVWRGSDGQNDQVFTLKIGVDNSQVQLSSGQGADEPRVYNNRVVWRGEDNTGYDQIFTQRVGVDASPVQLTPIGSENTGPDVWLNRVVWDGGGVTDPAYHVFTQTIGVDASPVQLFTGENNSTAYPPHVSADRIVWVAHKGGYDQVFYAKQVTIPFPHILPNHLAMTFIRHGGAAHWALSLTLSDSYGNPVAGRRVYLQTSTNGRTKWKNTYKLKTSATGRVSKKFTARRRMTLYYRWYAPASFGYRGVYSRKQKVRVK